MSFSVLGALFSFMLISSFTPGPGNILAMNTTISLGWKRSRALIFGICCGYLLIQTLCTLVLFTLNMVMEPVLEVLRYAGALYMVWLAVCIIAGKGSCTGKGNSSGFLTGMLLQVVNVKIYFYITTLLTAYLIPYITSLPLLLLAGVGVTAIGSLASLTWAVAGLKLQDFYKRHLLAVNSVLGLFLIYCAWEIIRG